MPPYISMNEHHPPDPIKQQHHNIPEDRTHICLSHLYLAQYLNAQPTSLGLFINWVSEEVLVPGKKKSFYSKAWDGVRVGCHTNQVDEKSSWNNSQA